MQCYNHFCQVHSRNVHFLRPHCESHSRSRLRDRKLNPSLGLSIDSEMMTTDGGRSSKTRIVRKSNKKIILSKSNNCNHVETRYSDDV